MATQPINSDTVDIPSVNFAQQGSDVAAPAAGRWQLFFKAGGLYARSNAGGVIGPFLTSLTGATDAAAIHDDTAGEIAAVTEKATPVSADLLLIEDSAASNAKKRVQIGNLPGGGSGSPGEGMVNILPHAYSDTAGSTSWNLTVSTSALYCLQLTGTGSAVDDHVDWQVYLAAGTYTLVSLHNRAGSGGQWQAQLDGTGIVTLECYTAVLTWNIRTVTAGIVVATSGLKTFRLYCTGKNASSAGYLPYFGVMTLYRTA